VTNQGESAAKKWRRHPSGILGIVPLVDLIDETFVVADPAALSRRLQDPELFRRWWPRREFVVFMDRGAQGVRWTVTGDVVGTCETWLEPFGDGAIVHFFLRADPTRRGSATEPLTGSPRTLARRARRVRRSEALTWKAMLNGVKDSLERDRPVGAPREESLGSGIKAGPGSADP
jgi:hypothetical protein